MDRLRHNPRKIRRHIGDTVQLQQQCLSGFQSHLKPLKMPRTCWTLLNDISRTRTKMWYKWVRENRFLYYANYTASKSRFKKLDTGCVYVEYHLWCGRGTGADHSALGEGPARTRWKQLERRGTSCGGWRRTGLNGRSLSVPYAPPAGLRGMTDWLTVECTSSHNKQMDTLLPLNRVPITEVYVVNQF